jgi:hypothetical protein
MYDLQQHMKRRVSLWVVAGAYTFRRKATPQAMTSEQHPYAFEEESDVEWPGDGRPKPTPKEKKLREKQRRLWERERVLTAHYEAGKVYEQSAQLAQVRTELREVELRLRLRATRGVGSATTWGHLRRAVLIFERFPDAESKGDFLDAASEIKWPEDLSGAEGESIWKGVKRLYEKVTGERGVPPRYAYFDGFRKLVRDLDAGRLTGRP